MSSGGLLLIAGALLWFGAAFLTPSELEAARRNLPIGARSVLVMAAYASAAICVLSGLGKARRADPS